MMLLGWKIDMAEREFWMYAIDSIIGKYEFESSNSKKYKIGFHNVNDKIYVCAELYYGNYECLLYRSFYSTETEREFITDIFPEDVLAHADRLIKLMAFS